MLLRMTPGLLAGVMLVGCSNGPRTADDGDDDGGTIGDDDVDARTDERPTGDAGAPDAAPPDAPPPDARPPQDLHVCATGGGEFTTIAAAIAAAYPGDTIHVCAGTYHEQLVIEGKALRLLGTSGAAETIVDGDGAGTPLTILQTGGAGVAVDGLTFAHGRSTSQGGALRCEDSTLQVANGALVSSTAAGGGGGLFARGCAVTIEASQFDQNDGAVTGGGAMLVGSSGTIHASLFTGNRAHYGGGVHSTEGSVAIDGNTFQSNTAAVRGGAIYHDSDALIASNQIIGNVAEWTGGGIHVVAHAPLLRDNTVQGNSAPNDGGGIYVHQGQATLRGNHVLGNATGDDGGGIRAFESQCTLEANLIEENRADDGGGGIRISHVPCTVIDNIVRNNVAGGTGGGMDLDNDASTVRGGEITGNVAGGSGGGIFTWLAPWNGTTIEDVLIANNRAWHGGGICAESNFQPLTMRRLRLVDNDAGRGGGLMIRGTNFTLSDSVFAGNDANTGGGVHHGVAEPWTDPCPCPPTETTGSIRFVVFYGNEGTGSALSSEAPGLTVEDSIVFANEGTQVSVSSAPAWRYNDTSPATFSGIAAPTGSDGNISVDPMFVDAAGGDFHLQGGSACIDAGDPAMTDPDGSRADLGLIGGAP